MSDSYQAVYDAVRSRISNCDVGAAVERAAREAFDIGWQKQHAQEAIIMAANEHVRPSVLFRPDVGLDGNMYFVLYGENQMDGCAGFGSTLAEAMADFDKNWFSQKAPASVDTRPKDEDPLGASLASGAVPEGQTPNPSDSEPNHA